VIKIPHYFICINCNKKYTSKLITSKYCSVKCKYDYKLKIKGDVIIKDNLIYIPLKTNIYTFIDLIDKDLAELNWSMYHNGYANNRKKSLHKTILERKIGYKISNGFICDHIDRNILNNTRNNLRIMPRECAKWNSNKPNINKVQTSKYKGVYYRKNKKFEVHIRYKSMLIYIGTFNDEIDAAKAYNNAAIKYFGEFASINEGI
jgi:hypothetical protein